MFDNMKTSPILLLWWIFLMSVGANDDENEEEIDDDQELHLAPIEGHRSGGLPPISDALFSLVILVYVSLAFCFVFFMFCWKSDNNGKNGSGNNRQCVLMTNNKPPPQPPMVIPPTPDKVSDLDLNNDLNEQDDDVMEMQHFIPKDSHYVSYQDRYVPKVQQMRQSV